MHPQVSRADRYSAVRAADYRVIICDESHFLKSKKARRTVELSPILQRAPHVVMLSGTPALSRPSELFPQVHVLAPTVIPPYIPYTIRYCKARQLPWGWDDTGASHLSELHLLLNTSVMIRRMKKDVMTQLPAKVRQTVQIRDRAVK